MMVAPFSDDSTQPSQNWSQMTPSPSPRRALVTDFSRSDEYSFGPTFPGKASQQSATQSHKPHVLQDSGVPSGGATTTTTTTRPKFGDRPVYHSDFERRVEQLGFSDFERRVEQLGFDDDPVKLSEAIRQQVREIKNQKLLESFEYMHYPECFTFGDKRGTKRCLVCERIEEERQEREIRRIAREKKEEEARKRKAQRWVTPDIVKLTRKRKRKDSNEQKQEDWDDNWTRDCGDG